MAANTPKKTMRAVVATQPGGPEVLEPTEIERPAPDLVEISVRVHAASINPTDWKSRARGGWESRVTRADQPVVLGFDVSGVVEEVGRGVTLFKPGDEVFGMPMFSHFPGAYAEYVVAPPRHFALKPAGIDHVQAAALPLVSLTAYQALTDMAGLRPGQRVLIHAAAGGVGHVAVQIAKALGAYVIGTASAAKHDFVRGLGADEVVDYTAVDFAEAVRDVDVVVDPIGGDYSERSLRTLRSGGTLVSLTELIEGDVRKAASERGINADFMLVEPDRGGMLAIAKLAEDGKLRPEVAAVLPLDDAAKAHELSETGRTVGKIVLSVVDEG
jgi:NADPH:quinone reductase-like Zn-dependent oxidoreductase